MALPGPASIEYIDVIECARSWLIYARRARDDESNSIGLAVVRHLGATVPEPRVESEYAGQTKESVAEPYNDANPHRRVELAVKNGNMSVVPVSWELNDAPTGMFSVPYANMVMTTIIDRTMCRARNAS